MKSKLFTPHIATLFLTLLLVAPTTYAQSSAFAKNILNLEQACPSLQCAQAQVYTRALSTAEINSLPKNLQEKLKSLSQQIAEEEWPDTILEGPYVAQLKIQLLRVEEIYKNKDLIGYRLTYSDRAWDTDSCNFDPRDFESLKQCAEGRLVESAFISTDLQEYVRDPMNYVNFFQP